MLCRQRKLEKARSRQRQQQQPSNQKLVQTNPGFLILYSFPFASAVSPSRNPFPCPLLCSIPVAGTWQPGVPWACCRPGKWTKPAGSDQSSKSIFICSSCIDQKINYSCSQICSLQLCDKDDTKETSWCRIPIIPPVPLALLWVSDVIWDVLLSKLLLCFFLRNVCLLPDDCSSLMGVWKGFWWSVQRWAIATVISEKTRITKNPFSLGEEKAKLSVVAPFPQKWLCQNRIGYWTIEVCFCPWPPQSPCAREQTAQQCWKQPTVGDKTDKTSSWLQGTGSAHLICTKPLARDWAHSLLSAFVSTPSWPWAAMVQVAIFWS